MKNRLSESPILWVSIGGVLLFVSVGALSAFLSRESHWSVKFRAKMHDLDGRNRESLASLREIAEDASLAREHDLLIATIDRITSIRDRIHRAWSSAVDESDNVVALICHEAKKAYYTRLTLVGFVLRMAREKAGSIATNQLDPLDRRIRENRDYWLAYSRDPAAIAIFEEDPVELGKLLESSEALREVSVGRLRENSHLEGFLAWLEASSLQDEAGCRLAGYAYFNRLRAPPERSG